MRTPPSAAPTRRAVRAAFPEAYRQSRSRDVLVETYITGRDYRCLVIGGKLAAVAERVPASVTGDGTRSIRELVEITNQDPRRGIGHEKVLTRIKIDEAAEELVRQQGFALDDIAPAGGRVKLALTGNMSTGGTSIDRTIEAHPDNVEIAEEAARVVDILLSETQVRRAGTPGEVEFLVTDDPERFSRVGEGFFGMELQDVGRVAL